MQSFHFVAVFLALSTATVMGGGDGCFKQFKNMKDVEASMDKCKTKLGLKDSDLVMPADLVKNGFEDKCMIKCVMTDLKYAKEDGTVDMKFVEDDLKKNAPDGKAEALTALLKECADTTAKDAAISKEPCKAIAKTKACYMMGQAKICPGA